jgi:Tfp pilus assembly protein PilF
MKLGRTPEGEDLLRRAVEIDPYEPEAIFAYSQALTAQGKPDEAKQWLDRHKRIVADLDRLRQLNQELLSRPDDAKVRCEIGLIFLRTGRENQAVQWLKLALQLDPRDAPAHQALAEYYERKGMVRDAAYHRGLAGQH